MKTKLKNLMELYGRLGLAVYLVLCLVTFGAAFALLRAGLQEMLPAWILAYLPADGTTFLGAYALYKAMQVPRIAFALVVTPILARWLGYAPAVVAETINETIGESA